MKTKYLIIGSGIIYIIYLLSKNSKRTQASTDDSASTDDGSGSGGGAINNGGVIGGGNQPSQIFGSYPLGTNEYDLPVINVIPKPKTFVNTPRPKPKMNLSEVVEQVVTPVPKNTVTPSTTTTTSTTTTNNPTTTHTPIVRADV